MRAFCSILLIGCIATCALTATAAPPVNLMPAASEVQWGESLPVKSPAIIVLSQEAGTQDREAARLLAQYVEKRLGQKWPIHAAQDAPKEAPVRVYLGQTSTFPALDQLCKEQNVSVPSQADGYALKVWGQGDTITAVVAGSNGLGVIYGQDTLFQLFAKGPGGVTVQAATIRDWPTIPLRGRPHPHYQYFFKDENFDIVMTSRFNFIDVRDGIYAFEPGQEIPKEEIGKIITKARNLGLRVYAAVNCGIPADRQEAAIGTFKEFIDLGANGLWLSFDDKGAGADPVGMVKRVIALGKEHGITGDAIATTPPKGDYQTVKTKFNSTIVQVPGMEQAVWYWTSIPCAEDLADAQSIGLRAKPSWWHNWPRLPHPSLSHGFGSHAYVPVVSLAEGWNHPNDRDLTEMGRYVHAIMPWDGWQAQQHYLIPVLGWWSWRPEQHDFKAVRTRIYDMVFGPGQVETAFAFDDTLNVIQDRFQYWATHTEFAPNCPPRLKSDRDRAQTRADLKGLQEKLAALEKAAPEASLLAPQLLQNEYLGAMKREVEIGLAETDAPYPEYWYPAYQDKILKAIYDGDTSAAEQLIARVRDRIIEQVAKVQELLGKSNNVTEYAKWWQDRAKATPADWQELLKNRQAELLKRVAEYNKTVAPFKEMLKNVDDPPVQIGTGIWERHNHVMATVLPEPRETFWGDWIGGLYEENNTQAAVFALAKHLRVNAGTHSELPVNIPISGKRDRLALIIYLADANKESFGLGRAKWRWAGSRAIKLLWNEKELWNADLGIPRLTGEWFVVPLPTLPDDLKTLPLRLRVEDYWSAKNNLEIVYVGPIRLLELDRD